MPHLLVTADTELSQTLALAEELTPRLEEAEPADTLHASSIFAGASEPLALATAAPPQPSAQAPPANARQQGDSRDERSSA